MEERRKNGNVQMAAVARQVKEVPQYWWSSAGVEHAGCGERDVQEDGCEERGQYGEADVEEVARGSAGALPARSVASVCRWLLTLAATVVCEPLVQRCMALWVDKHRPKTLDTLDFHRDVSERLKGMVQRGDFPHLLVYGPSGAGKKTRILALLREAFGGAIEKVLFLLLSSVSPRSSMHSSRWSIALGRCATLRDVVENLRMSLIRSGAFFIGDSRLHHRVQHPSHGNESQ